jgi:hypothetical protein
VKAAGMHATCSEATTTASKSAAATAAPCEGVIGNQCGADKHGHCEKHERNAKHDTPPCCLVPMLPMDVAC